MKLTMMMVDFTMIPMRATVPMMGVRPKGTPLIQSPMITPTME
jgi:hypothetical protein